MADISSGVKFLCEDIVTAHEARKRKMKNLERKQKKPAPICLRPLVSGTR